MMSQCFCKRVVVLLIACLFNTGVLATTKKKIKNLPIEEEQETLYDPDLACRPPAKLEASPLGKYPVTWEYAQVFTVGFCAGVGACVVIPSFVSACNELFTPDLIVTAIGLGVSLNMLREKFYLDTYLPSDS